MFSAGFDAAKVARKVSSASRASAPASLSNARRIRNVAGNAVSQRTDRDAS
jgi:hypothetical protein